MELMSGSEDPITSLSKTLQTIIIRLASCCEVSCACRLLILLISQKCWVRIWHSFSVRCCHRLLYHL